MTLSFIIGEIVMMFFKEAELKSAEKEVKSHNTGIMSSEAFFEHARDQRWGAKSGAVLAQLARQRLIYIGHKDLLAVSYSINREFPFLELYVSHKQYISMTKLLLEHGAPKEMAMCNSEYCPEDYVTFSYNDAEEMSKAVKVLSKLKLLDTKQEKEIMEYCQLVSASLPSPFG